MPEVTSSVDHEGRTVWAAASGGQSVTHYAEPDAEPYVPVAQLIDTGTTTGIELVHPVTGELLAQAVGLK